MNYFSLELSKKLAEKGLTSDSTRSYGTINGHTNPIPWCDHVIEGMPEQETRFTWTPALTLSDIILNKDNAIKLFSKGKELSASFSGWCLDEECNTNYELDEAWRWDDWQYQITILLDLHLRGGDVEAKLLKVLS